MLFKTKNRKNAVVRRNPCSIFLFVRSCAGLVFFLMTIGLLFRNVFLRRYRLWVAAAKIEADLAHSTRMILFNHHSPSLPHRQTRNLYERSKTKTTPQGSAGGGRSADIIPSLVNHFRIRFQGETFQSHGLTFETYRNGKD